MKTRLALVALLALGCHGTLPPEPGPPAAKVHMLSLGTERQDIGLDVAIRINDIPLGLARSGVETYFAEMTTTLKSYQVLHPYFLRTGDNVFTASYVVNDGREGQDFGPYGAAYTIADVDYEDTKLVVPFVTFTTRELQKTGIDLPPEAISGTFTVATQLPAWRWQHGRPITNNERSRDSLYAAYQRLWSDIDGAEGKSKSYRPYAMIRYDIREYALANEMYEGSFEDWDDFFAIASKRSTAYQKPVLLDPLPERDATALRVFANGTLAYLVAEPDSYFEHPVYIAIRGGAHDAPSGTMGPVNELIQPWFRHDDNGAWVIDGLTR